MYGKGTTRENAPFFEALSGMQTHFYATITLLIVFQTKAAGHGLSRCTVASHPSAS